MSDWKLRARYGDEKPTALANGFRIAGEKEWLLTGPSDLLDDVADAIPTQVERMGSGALLLTFGNGVGRVHLPHLGAVEIVSGKWGEDAFQKMLGDLVEISGSLPFSAGSGPLLPFETGATAPPVPYHAFLYLRHVLSDKAKRNERLLPVLEMVVRDPHKRWRRVSRNVPLEAASRVDESTVTTLLSGKLHKVDEELPRWASGGGNLALLAHRLGGQLPEAVVERQVRTEVDTPENRFVLHFLKDAGRIVSRVQRLALIRGGPFGDRLVRDAERCARQLDRVRNAPLWTQVGEARHLPLGSTVLQSRRGYRDVFDHWVKLRRMADLPLTEQESTALVEAKDIALLYELWCFFRLVRAVEHVLGPPTSSGALTASEWQVDVKQGYAVAWPGVTLHYNRAFSRGRRGMRHAYSTPLRPDIVLADRRDGARVLHLFDAKFRIKRSERMAGEVVTFKRADLMKMHAYRDAILAAETAWVLYPGEETAFFPADGERRGSSGIGAIAAAPESSGTELQRVIERLLRQ